MQLNKRASETANTNSYQIEVVETLSKTITVNAKGELSALQKVEEGYRNEEFTLDSSNYVETNFMVLKT